MNDNGAAFCAFLVGFFVGMLITLACSIHIDLYKRGQVDALTGKIRYELVVKADSTKSWEEISK
jgi:hypothetical protein